jgi:hypothetical protein
VLKNTAIDGTKTYLKPFSQQLVIVYTLIILVCACVMATIGSIQRQKLNSDKKFDYKMSLMTAIHGSFAQGNLKQD